MRIALISPFPPLKGGIARFSNRLLPALSEAGCQVLPVPFRRLYPRWLLNGRTAADSSLPVDTGSTFSLDLVNPLTWITTAIALRRIKPDVLLVAYWTGLLAPLCTVLRTITGIRTLVLLHNFTSHERLPAENLLQRLLRFSADGFVTLSASVQRELDATGNRLPSISLFHPLYEPSSPEPHREVARQALGLSDREKVLLFFGYVRRYKGLDLLLDAMAAVLRSDPAIRLVVAGEFIGSERYYRDMAGRLGIAGSVDFRPGYVPADEVGQLFAAADAVVLPYRSATQSGVVPLAFGYRVPVIACDAGDLSSQVEHGVSGWIVDRPDAAALAEGILEFFRSGGPAGMKDGIETARKALSWQVFSERLVAFLERQARGGA